MKDKGITVDFVFQAGVFNSLANDPRCNHKLSLLFVARGGVIHERGITPTPNRAGILRTRGMKGGVDCCRGLESLH